MKIKQIPAHLNITAAALAELIGVTKQSLHKYLHGARNEKSKFMIQLLAVSNLNQEEIIFPDLFDHPSGESPSEPAYWLNIALESIQCAIENGAPKETLTTIRMQLLEIGEKSINQSHQNTQTMFENGIQIATQNEVFKASQIKMATELLNKFNWEPKQKAILEGFQDKGYLIAPLNEALRAFHKSGCVDGDEKCILMLSWNGKGKNSLIIGAL